MDRAPRSSASTGDTAPWSDRDATNALGQRGVALIRGLFQHLPNIRIHLAVDGKERHPSYLQGFRQCDLGSHRARIAPGDVADGALFAVLETQFAGIIACGHRALGRRQPQRLVMAEGAELAPGLRGILGIVQIFVAIGGDPQHDFLGGNRLCGQRDHLVDPVDIRHRRIADSCLSRR